MVLNETSLDALKAQAARLGFTSSELDEDIIDMKCEEAGTINNNGLDAQLEAMCEHYGYKKAAQLLEDFAQDRERPEW